MINDFIKINMKFLFIYIRTFNNLFFLKIKGGGEIVFLKVKKVKF